MARTKFIATLLLLLFCGTAFAITEYNFPGNVRVTDTTIVHKTMRSNYNHSGRIGTPTVYWQKIYVDSLFATYDTAAFIHGKRSDSTCVLYCRSAYGDTATFAVILPRSNTSGTIGMVGDTFLFGFIDTLYNKLLLTNVVKPITNLTGSVGADGDTFLYGFFDTLYFKVAYGALHGMADSSIYSDTAMYAANSPADTHSFRHNEQGDSIYIIYFSNAYGDSAQIEIITPRDNNTGSIGVDGDTFLYGFIDTLYTGALYVRGTLIDSLITFYLTGAFLHDQALDSTYSLWATYVHTDTLAARNYIILPGHEDGQGGGGVDTTYIDSFKLVTRYVQARDSVKIANAADTVLITPGSIYGARGASAHWSIDTSGVTVHQGNDTFVKVRKNSSSVLSGYLNEASHNFSVISGGVSNVSDTDYTTIAGGLSNSAHGIFGAVGGGTLNQADSEATTVAGGHQNRAGNVDAFVGGGNTNTAVGYASSIVGGWNNTAGWAATFGTILGGQENQVVDSFAISGGRGSIAAYDTGHVCDTVTRRYVWWSDFLKADSNVIDNNNLSITTDSAKTQKGDSAIITTGIRLGTMPVDARDSTYGYWYLVQDTIGASATEPLRWRETQYQWGTLAHTKTDNDSNWFVRITGPGLYQISFRTNSSGDSGNLVGSRLIVEHVTVAPGVFDTFVASCSNYPSGSGSMNQLTSPWLPLFTNDRFWVDATGDGIDGWALKAAPSKYNYYLSITKRSKL